MSHHGQKGWPDFMPQNFDEIFIIITVRDRRDYFMCVLMYKCLNGKGPASLQDKVYLRQP